jgi:hypothetical protein
VQGSNLTAITLYIPQPGHLANNRWEICIYKEPPEEYIHPKDGTLDGTIGGKIYVTTPMFCPVQSFKGYKNGKMEHSLEVCILFAKCCE